MSLRTVSAVVNSGASQSPVALTVSASPFTWKNTNVYPVTVLIQGGTVSVISYSRDGVLFLPVGLLAGEVTLSPGDSVRVTYLTAPTIYVIPR
jgi:hypothetical protein